MSYVTEVIELVLARCGGITIPDPMDYVTIAEWEKQEIPLGLALDTVNNICASLTKDEVSNIKSAGYFQDSVKRNFREWLQVQDRESEAI